MKIRVYQLKDEPRNHGLQFAGSDKVREVRGEIDSTDYHRVYTGKVLPVHLGNVDSKGNVDVDAIYTRYQEDLPNGWAGHTLSVGDIICLYTSNWSKLYFVEPFGFSDITDEIAAWERRLLHEWRVSHGQEDNVQG